MFKKAVQRGRSEVRTRSIMNVTCADAGETVSRQCLARTKPAGFFNILLGPAVR
jgi:hypothetical protein